MFDAAKIPVGVGGLFLPEKKISLRNSQVFSRFDWNCWYDRELARGCRVSYLISSAVMTRCNRAPTENKSCLSASQRTTTYKISRVEFPPSPDGSVVTRYVPGSTACFVKRPMPSMDMSRTQT